ncbi:acyltransferase domain-containing protein [Streptomyces sp. NPDC048172]|uniref:acyltransferase domain-containing protein n=1 Tax=Streptomyces sp. NPDC048172 TaxID=3365505 RepID=UPI00371EDFF7
MNVSASASASASPPVALLLPGQGSQYDRMAVGLHAAEPVFAAALESVFEAMGEEGARVRADWLAERPLVPLDHATRSQPLLFAVDYALGRLVESWGVRPAALLGHSVGETVAATLGGVFRMEDAARLIVERTRVLVTAPPGGMLAVAAPERELTDVLTGDVVVGAVNAPRQTILAGPEEALRKAAEVLRERHLVCQTVPSHSAFHSPLMAPAALATEPLFAPVRTGTPTVPVYSAYTTAPLTPEQITDPAFWARQPAEPVLFWGALRRLLDDGDFTLLEAGPGQGLTRVARRHPAVRAGRSTVRPLLPAGPGPGDRDVAAVRAAADELVALGHRLG